MLKFFHKRRPVDSDTVTASDAAAKAGDLFDRGFNCSQAVFQATTGRSDPELIAMAEGFGGGIGDSGCLCGAISGGVMALGFAGKAKHSGELIAAFKDTYQTTCCRGLSKDYSWLSKDHLANCRKVTVTTARLVEQLLSK
ncbi:MAG: C_GCAxxG_C_C family protein [Deltaproteobacteria bacterium]|nr:C_GCAxxG_C_C family protein [Deltaproteobacteria bacterium]MBW2478249.1 C_GCAxxG_C_C family protein [Deltaproteobacteria bacterium]MBW2503092.1 C_GCAxxG_C_C family protein [Deltaproteobacteria bacterium]MBW2519852.1 C_GCAxxG_C_C family protein [Deltaproteobacteria bacterium]